MTAAMPAAGSWKAEANCSNEADSMKWQVGVDGRTIDVDSEQLASVKQVEPGVYWVLLDGLSFEIRIIEGPQGLSAEAGGRRFQVDVRDPRDTSRGTRLSIGTGRQNV